MKNKSLSMGIVAFISPVPLLAITAIWCLIWSLGIGIGLLNYETVPIWILTISVIPIFISPTLGLIGTIRGIKSKEKLSWLGTALSILGLSENAVLIYCIYYLGSNF